jgi:hypothetical protein
MRTGFEEASLQGLGKKWMEDISEHDSTDDNRGIAVCLEESAGNAFFTRSS